MDIMEKSSPRSGWSHLTALGETGPFVWVLISIITKITCEEGTIFTTVFQFQLHLFFLLLIEGQVEIKKGNSGLNWEKYVCFVSVSVVNT